MSEFDPMELAATNERILANTNVIISGLADIREEVTEVKASVSQLYDRVTAISGGQQTLRSDFHTLLEANMKHGKEIEALWRVVGIIGIVTVLLAVGFLAIVIFK